MASYMSEPTTVLIQDGTNLLCNKKPETETGLPGI
jgi:hypothetical protein